MSTRSTRLSVVAALAILAVAPAVTACSSFNPLESVVDGAIDEVTGGNLDVGGTEVPEDFPAEIPLIDGDVTSAFGVGKVPEKVWTVSIKVADASALDTIKSQLEGAGFTSDTGAGSIGGISGTVYTNADYGVLVVVADDGNDWVATYTVTPAVK